MKRQFLSVLMLCLLVSTSPSLLAANFAWLNNSAVRAFTDEDWTLTMANIRDTLDNAADGETRRWLNPASKAGGTATPLRTDAVDGVHCRILRTEQSAGGASGSSVQRFCQGEDGSWSFAKTRGRALAPQSVSEQ